jgi:hypothetical protein
MTDQAIISPPSRKRSHEVVIVSGLATSALTLLAVYLLGKYADFNPLLYYHVFVIPSGAILVGIAAGSGYGIASWLTGLKINKGLLVTVVLFQAWAYFLAEYLQYEHLVSLSGGASHVGFFQYLDRVTRSFAWKDTTTGLPGEPLGAWGYAFKALEVAGFIFGCLVLPLVLFKYPYCEPCGVYMRRRQLGLIPASISRKELKKLNKQAQSPEDRAVAAAMPEAAVDHAQATLARLRALAAADDAQAFQAALAELAPERKATAKLPQRIAVALCGCRRCAAGRLEATMLSGQGKQTKKQPLSPSPMSPAAVAAILNP